MAKRVPQPGPQSKAKSRPKTGDPRETHQPLKIDRLPAEVHDAIQYLYTRAGKTWIQIEAQSAIDYNPAWQAKGGGFVNWQDLPLAVLELFPEMRLPKSNLHRWFDLRIAQVREATMQRAEHARVLAESFAGADLAGDKEAVLYAARDIFFGILAEDGSLPSRAAAGKALLALAKEQQKSRTNDIRERQVAADERKVKLLEQREAALRKKLEAETEKLSVKAKRGEVTPADVDRLRERTFGLPPVQKTLQEATA